MYFLLSSALELSIRNPNDESVGLEDFFLFILISPSEIFANFLMNFESPVTAAVINNINGVGNESVVKEVRCEVCNILVSSYVS